jgi:hypothetical protein
VRCARSACKGFFFGRARSVEPEIRWAAGIGQHNINPVPCVVIGTVDEQQDYLVLSDVAEIDLSVRELVHREFSDFLCGHVHLPSLIAAIASMSLVSILSSIPTAVSAPTWTATKKSRIETTLRKLSAVASSSLSRSLASLREREIRRQAADVRLRSPTGVTHACFPPRDELALLLDLEIDGFLEASANP